MNVVELIASEKQPLNQVIPVSYLSEIESQPPEIILIDATHISNALRLIESVRQHATAELSLTPIIFVTSHNEIDTAVQYADGQTTSDKLDEAHLNDWIRYFDPIYHFIRQLLKHPGHKESRPARRLLQIIASRSKKINPIQTSANQAGFIYPLLEPLVSGDSEKLQRLLQFLESEYLLDTEVINRSHFCQFCDCAFLNFKECCPDCNSDDLSPKELIHHFNCAYVAPVEDFKKTDNRLVCPKCDKRLQHIGVDYDKPSTVYNCNQCQLNFQEPNVTSECFSCHRLSATSDLILRPIKAYELSSLGQNAALYGIDSLFSQLLEDQLTVVEFTTFKHFLKLEQLRTMRYKKTESTLAVIKLIGVEETYLALGNKANDYITELANLFVTTFRETDVLSVRNETLFCALLTDTDLSGAKRALQRVEEVMDKLASQSENTGIRLKYDIQPVSENLKLSNTIDHLSQE